MIGNRNAAAAAYIAAAAIGVAVVAVLLAAAAREVDRARRREKLERREAFTELEKLTAERDRYLHVGTELGRYVEQWSDVILEATEELLPCE
jgi:flagellar biosynthesis/type III secretory pathway M-ring protein FliF/YscJ